MVAIGWWRLIGKKLRARLKLETAIAALPFAHERWVQLAGKADLRVIKEAQKSRELPRFGLHLHCAHDDDLRRIQKVICSLVRQSHAPVAVLVTREEGSAEPDGPDWDQVTMVSGVFSDRMEGLRGALEAAMALRAQWVIPVDAAMPLPRHALASYVAHLLSEPGPNDLVLLYGDEESPTGQLSKKQLWLKPEWDSRMILSQDYVSAGCALGAEAALEVFGEHEPTALATLYELVLRLATRDPSPAIRHVTRIVAKTEAMAWCENGEQRVEAVRQVLGEKATVSSGPFGTVEVHYPLPDPAPSVSIVVATRDRVELLRTCVDGVLCDTDYPNFDLIIADNDSVDPEALSYMDEVSADPRVKVVRWPHAFNYSAINNFAVGETSGEYVCLLNNDIEVIETDWLSAMVREAVQPGIGAVGARLLYPDRSIQHAGVAVGIGNAAGHAHRGLAEGEPGYFAQAHITRGASAVTAACLLVARQHFYGVGGLDEQKLAVAYNDVDLCLKLRAAGLNNIFTPRATLIHHESKSRGMDFAPEHFERYMRELAAFQDRWDAKRVVDPWHHPRLDRSQENYVV
ncbi:glycosyltransferase family 2 protein [Erythrobacter litoralis]|uniref:glycosyltransferase family 2 protein n=1 Tax=Erythrobacter litoralis TaxID=39960 RepID=UPI001376CB3F|nr:glycosyltransferase family 2 protein [Erythrobacter litoralis]